MVRSTVSQNVSLLAETGYAEGQMCHILAVPGREREKALVAVSAPMLIRSRKILVNVMINHEGLETLLQVRMA